MTQISDEIVERMVALVRKIAKQQVPDTFLAAHSGNVHEARAIVAELPKPVDPDVLAVRIMLSEWHFEDGVYGGYLREGREDGKPDFQRALTAYKRIKAGYAA